MSSQATHELDLSIGEAALELEALNFLAPEIFLLLGTGAEDMAQLLQDPIELPLGELPGCPHAWMGANLCAGRIGDVRAWALTDEPAPDLIPWGRAWPVWLARVAGAGACMITAAGSALPDAGDTIPTEGFLFVSDHMVLEGDSPLRGLTESNLGPLFPDQGRIHDATLRAGVLEIGSNRGLPCTEGILACVPGPTVETPAERAFYAKAGAHASTQDLGAVLHAMAHCGLGGLTIIALVGQPDATIEDLLNASSRLAPGLAEIIETAIDPLADRARLERQEEL